MIRSFASRDTEALFHSGKSRKLPSEIIRRALIKLLMLDAAVDINDLRVPPAHRLEQLKGKRAGQYSIRINDQWRICFVWRDAMACEV